MAFLNKKSWHTGSLRMMEKVWKAERAAEEEKKKIETLKKELEEERKVESLRRMQQDAGLLTKNQVERLDWMYVGTAALKAQESERECEEYLLGKVKTEVNEGAQELKALAHSAGSKLLASAAGASSGANEVVTLGAIGSGSQAPMSKVRSELEQSALLREDPLMAIMRQQQTRTSEIKSNPYRMKQLKEVVLREKLLKELEKAKTKEAKKEAKKMKKEEKKRERKERKRRRSSSSSRSRSRSRGRSRSRSRRHRSNEKDAAAASSSTLAAAPALPTPSSSSLPDGHAAHSRLEQSVNEADRAAQAALDSAAMDQTFQQGEAEAEPGSESRHSRGGLTHPSGRDKHADDRHSSRSRRRSYSRSHSRSSSHRSSHRNGSSSHGHRSPDRSSRRRSHSRSHSPRRHSRSTHRSRSRSSRRHSDRYPSTSDRRRS